MFIYTAENGCVDLKGILFLYNVLINMFSVLDQTDSVVILLEGCPMAKIFYILTRKIEEQRP